MLARAWHWIREQLPFLIVAGGVVAGFVYLVFEPSHWRRGTGIIAAAMLVGALLRLFIRPPRVGLLAVRTKWLDVGAYLLLGGLVLAVDIRLQS